MKHPSSIAKAALLAVISATVLVSGACHEADYVVNPPNWNEIPPGPSPVVEETRPASGVTEVVLDGVGLLFVHQGGVESLLIRTEERILPFITTEQRGGRLEIGFRDGTSYHGQASAIEFHLTVASLESLEHSGTGGISASNISTGRLSVVHRGVGSVNLSGLDATRLDLTRSGTGGISLSGTVQQQSIVLGGVGNCEARNLDSAEADVTILGFASATVRVSDRLDARIDGSGSVYYLGNPTVQRTGHGSGSVEPL